MCVFGCGCVVLLTFFLYKLQLSVVVVGKLMFHSAPSTSAAASPAASALRRPPRDKYLDSVPLSAATAI